MAKMVFIVAGAAFAESNARELQKRGHSVSLLGQITAAILEGAENEYASRFAWLGRGEQDHEAARYAE